MRVKIDTREKFHVITITEPEIAANMTADLDDCIFPFLQKDVKNVVINLKEVESLEQSAAEHLIKLQQTFYDQQSSFVICELQEQVEDRLDDQELLELMNTTPTESEAWDIVQMEEIERELLGGE